MGGYDNNRALVWGRAHQSSGEDTGTEPCLLSSLSPPFTNLGFLGQPLHQLVSEVTGL